MPSVFNDSTDASLDAYIGVLLPHSVRSPRPLEWEGSSMYWKVLNVVHLSLISFQDQLKGHCSESFLTALACIRKEGSLASEALWDLAKDLLLFAQSKDISLYPVHMRRRLNVLADKASRDGPISMEWSLDRDSFKRIWGVPLDLFAIPENSQLPQFASPCPDPCHLGCDALDDSLDWNQLRSIYLFPPFQLRGSFVETEGLQGFRPLGDAILTDGSLVRTLRGVLPEFPSQERPTCSRSVPGSLTTGSPYFSGFMLGNYKSCYSQRGSE